jgi:hypothetical protein
MVFAYASFSGDLGYMMRVQVTQVLTLPPPTERRPLAVSLLHFLFGWKRRDVSVARRQQATVLIRLHRKQHKSRIRPWHGFRHVNKSRVRVLQDRDKVVCKRHNSHTHACNNNNVCARTLLYLNTYVRKYCCLFMHEHSSFPYAPAHYILSPYVRPQMLSLHA